MITEIFNDPAHAVRLDYRYLTDSTYEVKAFHDGGGWRFDLRQVSLPGPVEKSSQGLLFDPVVENPKCFKYSIGGREAAYLQIGHQTWNNRMRVWDFLVLPDYRRTGIGTKLMALARAEAEKAGARMLVLETQSCNTAAVEFYLKSGFQLIGFDLAHYANDDVRRNEFRLEFGLFI